MRLLREAELTRRGDDASRVLVEIHPQARFTWKRRGVSLEVRFPTETQFTRSGNGASRVLVEIRARASNGFSRDGVRRFNACFTRSRCRARAIGIQLSAQPLFEGIRFQNRIRGLEFTRAGVTSAKIDWSRVPHAGSLRPGRQTVSLYARSG